ncbi:MAG TPA: putative toxin-antitoxin system toxin component, PIN family [Bryobacteraceae bacterium]|nr:putative toxin-antitoxin system toxin component, PIN family [Bryobacteraceae bacterium]
MLALRLVLDTNVVVSGALKPRGLERTALIFALTPPAGLFVSQAILDEYIEVLSRAELHIPSDERQPLMDLITRRGRLVVPGRKLEVCHDPDDNIFLECAETARADYLITGNNKHFPRYWRSTKIINARELLEVIAPHLPL